MTYSPAQLIQMRAKYNIDPAFMPVARGLGCMAWGIPLASEYVRMPAWYRATHNINPR